MWKRTVSSSASGEQLLQREFGHLEQELKQLEQRIAALEAASRKPRAIYLGDHEILTELHTGHRIYVDARDVGICAHLMWHGRWEPWIEPVLLAQVEQGMCVADVGANFGYYTLLMAEAVGADGHVFSFEANPEIHRKLRKSIAVNGFSDRITDFNVALSNGDGAERFRFDPVFSGGGALCDASTSVDGHTIEVQVRALDALMPVDRPLNFMKIDVEGAEPLVLEGARASLERNSLRSIVMEFSAQAIARYLPPLQLLQSLSARGFEFRKIEPSGLGSPMSPDQVMADHPERLTYLLLVR